MEDFWWSDPYGFTTETSIIVVSKPSIGYRVCVGTVPLGGLYSWHRWRRKRTTGRPDDELWTFIARVPEFVRPVCSLLTVPLWKSLFRNSIRQRHNRNTTDLDFLWVSSVSSLTHIVGWLWPSPSEGSFVASNRDRWLSALGNFCTSSQRIIRLNRGDRLCALQWSQEISGVRAEKSRQGGGEER